MKQVSETKEDGILSNCRDATITSGVLLRKTPRLNIQAHTLR
jgi:hypothetical protein